jgi:hypothetical protein
MRSIEKRQTRRWLAAFHDPYRKLAAIVLAIGLWFLINLQIEDSKTLTMRLVVVDQQRTTRPNTHQVSVELPLGLIVGRKFLDGDTVIETVKVELSGPRGRIETIDKEPIDLQVRGLLTNERTKSDAASQGFVEFTKADIQRTLQLSKDIRIELSPARIRLQVESIKNYPLELSPSVIDLHVDDPDLAKRLRLDTATFSHQTAVILGPASELEKINRSPGAKLLHAWLKGAASERQITTVVDLAAEHKDLGLRLEETPSMTIPLLPYTEMFELEVPILIDDLALPVALQGKYRPDPEARTKTVRVKAGGRLLAYLTSLRDGPDKNQLRAWALANLRLNLWVAPLEPDAPPPADFLCSAVLTLQGPLRSGVERNECELGQTELFRLRRIP